MTDLPPEGIADSVVDLLQVPPRSNAFVTMVRKLPKYLLVLIGVAAFAFVAYVAWQVYGFLREFNQAFDLLTAQYGVNHWLARAMALVLVSPLGLGIKRGFFGFSKHKHVIRLATASYAVVYCLAMFAVSRSVSFSHSSGGMLQWYAETPEGVRFFDSDGYDPKYGIKLKPVTPEMRINLARRELGQAPKRMVISGSDSVTLFDPLTGTPRAWYYLAPDGQYELFDAPGFHPENGSPLQEMTREAAPLIRDWIARRAASETMSGLSHAPQTGVPAGRLDRRNTPAHVAKQVDTGHVPSSPKSVEGAFTPAQRVTPAENILVLSTIQTAEVGVFRFDLKRCKSVGTTVTCDFVVLNEGEDRALDLGDWYKQITRIVDDSGNEFSRPNKRRLGSESGDGPKTMMVSGVPVRGAVTFDNTSTQMSTIALLEIAYRVYGREGGIEDSHVARFRDVPVAK